MPPNGLEPLTPSLPCGLEPLPWVADGCELACLSRFRECGVCRRLPPVAPALLHKCSILPSRIRGLERSSGVRALMAVASA
jgi:hypothetical protein